MARSAGEILREVHDFYEKNPFPGFDIRKYSCREDLRSRASWFGRLVDAQIPFGARVADIGCGTGQLANFLALKDRLVVGVDVSERSVMKARELRDKLRLGGVVFSRQDALELGLAEGSFDFVFSLGVLHHTSDPAGGFRQLARLTGPGGFVVVGLYHRMGRLVLRARQAWARASWSKRRTEAIRRQIGTQDTADIEKEESWYADQYEHPHESVHTVGEVLGWFAEGGLEFVNSLPPVEAFSTMKGGRRLFHPSRAAPWRRSALCRRLVELWWTGSLASGGGYFLLVGRKRGRGAGPGD